MVPKLGSEHRPGRGGLRKEGKVCAPCITNGRDTIPGLIVNLSFEACV